VTLTGAHEGSRKLSILDFTHSNNINRDSGIEIPEAWIHVPTIKKHNSQSDL